MVRYLCSFYDDFGYLIFKIDSYSYPKFKDVIQFEGIDYIVTNLIEYEKTDCKDCFNKLYFMKYKVEIMC